MAKNKKGKTAPISRPAKRKTAPGANAPPAENCWRYAPALCLLALAAAVFGLHLGYAGGDANRYLMMDHAGRIAGIYQVSQNNDFPLPYALQTFNYLFPDILITLGLSHLLGSPYAAIHVYAALSAFVMAAGCWLLTRRLCGNAMAQTALPVAGLMMLLIVYGETEELFTTLTASAFRNGLMALQPLLLYFSIGVLFSDSASAKKHAAALFVALFFLQVSFIITAVWFVIPVVASFILARLRGIQMPHWKMFAAASAGSYFAANLMREPLAAIFFESAALNEQAAQVSFSLSAAWHKAKLFWIWISAAAARHPLLTAVWIVFMAACIRTAWLAQTKEKNKPPHKHGAMFFTAVFFCFAVLLGPAVAVLTAKFGIWGRVEHFANHRYFEPSVYWPLFLGWPVLLGFWLPRLPARFSAGAAWVAPVFAAAVLLPALPLWRHLPEINKLWNFSMPFTECVSENAGRHGLKQGIGPGDLASLLSAHAVYPDKPIPAVGVINYRIYARATKQPFAAGQFPFFKNPQAYVPESITKDGFNFIMLNSTDAKKLHGSFPDFPRCPQRLANPEQCLDGGEWDFIGFHFIDAQLVTDYYGKPDSRFRCSGVDFYVYKNGLDAGNYILE